MASALRFADCELLLDRHRLLRRGKEVGIEPKVFDLISYLARHPGRTITKEELVREVWQGAFVTDAAVKRAISEARKAVGDDGSSQRIIRTVRKRGYSLRASVVRGGEVRRGSLRADDAEPAPLGTTSVAVLPFRYLGPEDGRFLGEGLTEELIRVVAQMPGVQVAARSSVFRLEEAKLDPPEVARQLGVAAVVEATVQPVHDRLCVSIRLIDGTEGLLLWSGRYERRLDELPELQAELSRGMTRALAPRAAPSIGRLAGTAELSSEAYRLYLKGRFQWERLSPEGFHAAVHYFEEAKAADPTFALPHAWLAVTYHYMCTWGYAHPAEHRPLVEAEARRALELDDSLPEVHEALGLVHQYYHWEWERTERHYRQAMAIAPGDTVARTWLGLYLIRFPHRDEEIMKVSREALAGDSSAFETNMLMTYALTHSGRAAQAPPVARRLVSLYPNRSLSYVALGVAMASLESWDEAIRALRQGLDVAGDDPYCRSLLAHALACAGRDDEARLLRDELSKLRATAYFPALGLAAAFLGAGDRERALGWIDTALDERESLGTFINVWPLWQPLHGEGRFETCLARMGLQLPRPS